MEREGRERKEKRKKKRGGEGERKEDSFCKSVPSFLLSSWVSISATAMPTPGQLTCKLQVVVSPLSISPKKAEIPNGCHHVQLFHMDSRVGVQVNRLTSKPFHAQNQPLASYCMPSYISPDLRCSWHSSSFKGQQNYLLLYLNSINYGSIQFLGSFQIEPPLEEFRLCCLVRKAAWAFLFGLLPCFIF